MLASLPPRPDSAGTMTVARSPEPPVGPPPRSQRDGGVLRSLGRLALWAGPLGVGLALAVLLAGAAAGHFRSGPGVPTAGDSRAWTEMWGALGLVVAGTVTGVLANAAWVVVTLRGARRPGAGDWARLLVHALLAGLLGWAIGGR